MENMRYYHSKRNQIQHAINQQQGAGASKGVGAVAPKKNKEKKRFCASNGCTKDNASFQCPKCSEKVSSCYYYDNNNNYNVVVVVAVLVSIAVVYYNYY